MWGGKSNSGRGGVEKRMFHFWGPYDCSVNVAKAYAPDS